MSRLFAETFAWYAIEGRREACNELVANYAHVYRETPKAVLIAISAMLMDPANYSYGEYDKIKKMIVEMMEETR